MPVAAAIAQALHICIHVCTALQARSAFAFAPVTTSRSK